MRPLTGILLGILAATLAAAWFFSHYERVQEREWKGYSGEALYNDYFAAEQLFRALDVESDSLPAWAPHTDLTAPEDTVVTRVSFELATEPQSTFALQWVSSGGHLVLLPAYEDSVVTERFLAAVGFELLPVEREEESVIDDDPEQESGSDDYDYTAALHQTHVRIAAQAETPVSASLSDELGLIAARREYGDGFVTVFADAGYFSNEQLADSDHARLLLDAIAGYLEPGKVWFIFDAEFQSLWSLLLRAFPWLVLCTALALLAWIGALLPGFGPGVPDRAESRRSILEHVQAAGLFAWRHRGANDLVRSTVDATLRAAEIRRPGIGRLAPAEQAAVLSSLTGLPAERIDAALRGAVAARPREFAECIHLLRLAREKL